MAMEAQGTTEASQNADEPAAESASSSGRRKDVDVVYRQYADEDDLPLIMRLVDNELSEPYSIFTYRYFLHNWPSLCYLAFDGAHCFGTIVCKLDSHGEFLRGYIAMLVVEQAYRGLGVGSVLVRRAITEMKAGQADEVVLEAEITNRGALALYEKLGFIRDKRLIRYYLSGTDAFRLKLLLPLPPERQQQMVDEQLAAEELMRLQLNPPGPDPQHSQPVASANGGHEGSPFSSAGPPSEQNRLGVNNRAEEGIGRAVGASSNGMLPGSCWEAAGKLSEAEKLGLVAESRAAEMSANDVSAGTGEEESGSHDAQAGLRKSGQEDNKEGVLGASRSAAGRPQSAASQGNSVQASKSGKKGKRTKK